MDDMTKKKRNGLGRYSMLFMGIGSVMFSGAIVGFFARIELGVPQDATGIFWPCFFIVQWFVGFRIFVKNLAVYKDQ